MPHQLKKPKLPLNTTLRQGFGAPILSYFATHQCHCTVLPLILADENCREDLILIQTMVGVIQASSHLLKIMPLSLLSTSWTSVHCPAHSPWQWHSVCVMEPNRQEMCPISGSRRRNNCRSLV